MKIIFVVLCMFVFFTGIEGVPRAYRNEVFMNNLVECKKKVDASEGDVEILKRRQRLSTRASQCLMACIKKKMGLMAEDNSIILSASKESLETLKHQNKHLYDQLLQTLETCKGKETVEKDECVAAKKFSDCIIDIREKEKIYD